MPADFNGKGLSFCSFNLLSSYKCSFFMGAIPAAGKSRVSYMALFFFLAGGTRMIMKGG